MRKWSNKSLPGLLLLAAALPVVTGCYEGWDYDRKGEGTGNPPTPIPTPSTPPFFYIQLDPILLSTGAIADDGCFAEPGVAAFRQAEWAERIQALSAVLQPLAVNFKVVPHQIAKDDCKTLAALRTAAITAAPWAPDPDPADDPLDRSLVDVRAVFWEGDVEADPPAVVTAKQWVAFANLAKAGRKAKTVNHFILEHEAEGYFHTWAKGIDAGDQAAGTPINDVDPSDTGIKARTATIAADAQAVAKWLTEHP
jgi:hypothetical protein